MLANLLALLRAARPGMTLVPRCVVEAIVLTGGSLGPARDVAGWLGLRNRFELARLLKREGLPPLHRLAAWTTVISWLEASERDGVSLCQLAYHSGRHPAACYRLVKEVTGQAWEQTRARGSLWAAEQFLRELRGRTAAR